MMLNILIKMDVYKISYRMCMQDAYLFSVLDCYNIKNHVLWEIQNREEKNEI